MSLIRRDPARVWDPFRELEDMSARLNRLFARPAGSDEMLKGVDWSPSSNISETANAYLIKAELPGVKKEDVHVSVEAGVLTLRGERKHEQEHKDERFHRVESMYGTFMRRFALPDDAAAEGIEASYKDGLLTVKLPKVAEKPPEAKRVTIS